MILIMACGKYVNSVSFLCDDEVFKTLDRRSIDSITDWGAVSLNTVGNAMYAP